MISSGSTQRYKKSNFREFQLESQILEGHLWRCSSPLLAQAGCCSQTCPVGLEHLQKFLHLSGQSVPVFDFSWSKTVVFLFCFSYLYRLSQVFTLCSSLVILSLGRIWLPLLHSFLSRICIINKIPLSLFFSRLNSLSSFSFSSCHIILFLCYFCAPSLHLLQ